jgi:divalent metal cation (Fe/Co/Zn/Cd) transporter
MSPPGYAVIATIAAFGAIVAIVLAFITSRHEIDIANQENQRRSETQATILFTSVAWVLGIFAFIFFKWAFGQ